MLSLIEKFSNALFWMLIAVSPILIGAILVFLPTLVLVAQLV